MTRSRYPDFLIIGAMKAGTTGLFLDLCRHPQIFLQESKEPHCLCSEHVLTEAGQREYATLYAGAEENQLTCDASTGYSKRPDHTGVVERAVQLLPSNFKVVYVVRDPVDRIISQFRHEQQAGSIDLPIDEAIDKCPRFVNYSRYGYQIKPWVEAIGRERVCVVRFEDYKDRRQAIVEQVCEFLGLPADKLPAISPEVYNQSEGKPVAGRLWGAISCNPLYRQIIRPLLSVRLRLLLQKWVLPKSKVASVQLSEQSLAEIERQMQQDAEELKSILGKT